MPKIKKTIRNPHGLSLKQQVVIQDMIEDVSAGRGLSPAKSHSKIYNVKTPKNGAVVAQKNLHKVNFREALMEGLRERKILGENSLVEKRLNQGLNAKTQTPRGDKLDLKVILEYIKEINKIGGMYAPEKRATARFNFNIGDAGPEELKRRAKELRKELQGA